MGGMGIMKLRGGGGHFDGVVGGVGEGDFHVEIFHEGRVLDPEGTGVVHADFGFHVGRSFEVGGGEGGIGRIGRIRCCAKAGFAR